MTGDRTYKRIGSLWVFMGALTVVAVVLGSYSRWSVENQPKAVVTTSSSTTTTLPEIPIRAETRYGEVEWYCNGPVGIYYSQHGLSTVNPDPNCPTEGAR